MTFEGSESTTPGRRRRGLARSRAEEEARLGRVGRRAEGEVSGDRRRLESGEPEEGDDLGGRVEVALRVLDRAGLEELPHDVTAPRDRIQGELPHDLERALAVPPEEHRPRSVSPPEGVEHEIPTRLEGLMDHAKRRDERGP